MEKIKSIKNLIWILLMQPLCAWAEPLPQFDCLIEPEQVIELDSPLNGLIEKVYVDKGDIIKKDQLLVELESSVEQATVYLKHEQANYDVEIKSRKVELDQALDKYKRLRKLIKSAAISKVDMDDAVTEKHIATLELEQSKQDKIIANLELNRAVKVLDRMKIRSPVDGVVIKKYLSPGESVKEKKILQIAQINPLKIKVIVPALYYGQISKGMKAKIIPEIGDTESYQAEVTIIDQVVDASSGTYEVRLRLSNDNYNLPSGISCQAEFETDGLSAPQNNNFTQKPTQNFDEVDVNISEKKNIPLSHKVSKRTQQKQTVNPTVKKLSQKKNENLKEIKIDLRNFKKKKSYDETAWLEIINKEKNKLNNFVKKHYSVKTIKKEKDKLIADTLNNRKNNKRKNNQVQNHKLDPTKLKINTYTDKHFK